MSSNQRRGVKKMDRERDELFREIKEQIFGDGDKPIIDLKQQGIRDATATQSKSASGSRIVSPRSSPTATTSKGTGSNNVYLPGVITANRGSASSPHDLAKSMGSPGSSKSLERHLLTSPPGGGTDENDHTAPGVEVFAVAAECTSASAAGVVGLGTVHVKESATSGSAASDNPGQAGQEPSEIRIGGSFMNPRIASSSTSGPEPTTGAARRKTSDSPQTGSGTRVSPLSRESPSGRGRIVGSTPTSAKSRKMSQEKSSRGYPSASGAADGGHAGAGEHRAAKTVVLSGAKNSQTGASKGATITSMWTTTATRRPHPQGGSSASRQRSGSRPATASRTTGNSSSQRATPSMRQQTTPKTTASSAGGVQGKDSMNENTNSERPFFLTSSNQRVSSDSDSLRKMLSPEMLTEFDSVLDSMHLREVVDPKTGRSTIVRKVPEEQVSKPRKGKGTGKSSSRQLLVSASKQREISDRLCMPMSQQERRLQLGGAEGGLQAGERRPQSRPTTPVWLDSLKKQRKYQAVFVQNGGHKYPPGVTGGRVPRPAS
ncbi:unnamed protein product, partial [Amoebophrya sp. A25]|eukprot:GSA25T00007613001.1